MGNKRWHIHLRCERDIAIMFSKRKIEMNIIEDVVSMNMCSEPFVVIHGEHHYGLLVADGEHAWSHRIETWHGWSRGGRSGLEGWHVSVDLPAGYSLFAMPIDGKYSRSFFILDDGEWWFDPKKGWSRG